MVGRAQQAETAFDIRWVLRAFFTWLWQPWACHAHATGVGWLFADVHWPLNLNQENEHGYCDFHFRHASDEAPVPFL